MVDNARSVLFHFFADKTRIPTGHVRHETNNPIHPNGWNVGVGLVPTRKWFVTESGFHVQNPDLHVHDAIHPYPSQIPGPILDAIALDRRWVVLFLIPVMCIIGSIQK